VKQMRCTICKSELDPDDAIEGYLGMIEIAFCPWCYSSVVDMVFVHYNIEPKE
tara:strand:+ start:357 stop:515 length:159 start_codon:yes stop_codon:yes gene_type:complete